MTAALEMPPPDRSVPSHGAATGLQERLQILLTDDNALDRKLIRRVARGSVFEIDWLEAGSVAEARAQLSARRPDALLLDVHLPDGDGIELAREVAAHPDHAGVPVIVVTGEGDAQAALRALRSGTVDYLVKEDLCTELFDAAIRSVLAALPRRRRNAPATGLASQDGVLLPGGRVWASRDPAEIFVLPVSQGAWTALNDARRNRGRSGRSGSGQRI